MPKYDHIPTDDRVVAALGELGGASTAKTLCDRLVGAGYPRADTQLGIQRTVERGGIELMDDWTLRLTRAATDIR